MLASVVLLSDRGGVRLGDWGFVSEFNSFGDGDDDGDGNGNGHEHEHGHPRLTTMGREY
jgi:hypothetical protein